MYHVEYFSVPSEPDSFSTLFFVRDCLEFFPSLGWTSNPRGWCNKEETAVARSLLRAIRNTDIKKDEQIKRCRSFRVVSLLTKQLDTASTGMATKSPQPSPPNGLSPRAFLHGDNTSGESTKGDAAPPTASAASSSKRKRPRTKGACVSYSSSFTAIFLPPTNHDRHFPSLLHAAPLPLSPPQC